jgi:hypothetical protein
MDPASIANMMQSGSSVIRAAAPILQAPPSTSATGPTIVQPTFGSFDVVAGGWGSVSGARAIGSPSGAADPVIAGGSQLQFALLGLLALAALALVIRR